MNSSIYYRRIVSLDDEAIKRGVDATELYLSRTKEETIQEDLTDKILILAGYSDYQRIELEKVKHLLLATVVIGILTIPWLLFVI